MGVLKKFFNKTLEFMYPGKSTDTKEVNDLKKEMFSNTYCVIGFSYTVLYLIIDMFIRPEKVMAYISIGFFVAIIITIILCIRRVRNIIENNLPNLQLTKRKLQIVAAFSGWVAPVVFVVSIIVNFID